MSNIFSAGFRVIAFVTVAWAAPLSGYAQPGAPASQEGRRLTVDEAVRAALQNNLGIQIARVDPLVQDLGIARARGAWAPTFSSTLQATSIDVPSNSFLSGAQ